MRRVPKTTLCSILVMSLVLSACSGNDESSDGGGSDANPASASAYSITPPDSDDDIVSVDGEELDEPLPFAGPVELVERGVELGEWTEVEGVIALLKVQADEIPADEISALDLVASSSGSDLLRLASRLADDDAVSDEDRAELRRLLDLVEPPRDLIEAAKAHIAGLDGLDLPGIRGPVSGAVPAQATDCVDGAPTDYPYVRRAPRVKCWKVKSRWVSRPGEGTEVLVAVIYPDGSEAAADITLEALETTSLAAFQWSPANPTTYALLTPDRLTNAKRQDVWGVATKGDGNDCMITLSQRKFTPDDTYRQLVAHEQIHCFQTFDYASLDDSWVIEGGAEYFSHLIYPAGGLERPLIETFFARSLKTPLMKMTYESWVWWQYMSNHSSPEYLFDLHRRMAAGDAVEVLAAEPGMAELFQTFTVDLRTVGIPTHGPAIPESREVIEVRTIASTGERSHTAGRFVAVRLGIFYVAKHRFEQTDHTETGGYMQVARHPDRYDRSAWRGLPPEVRSTCTDREVFVMAVTTIHPEPHKVHWTIDEADEFSCDPCLAGTWILDNDRFLDTIMSFGGMPAGFSVDLVGPYYVRFDRSSSGNAWRNNWKMITSGSAEGMSVNMTVTWDSIETFEYSADGERFEAWNSVIVDHRTTMDAGGLPIGAMATPDASTVSAFGFQYTTGTESDGPQSAGGSYTCTNRRLEISLDMAPGTPLVLDRTQDIPEPPLVLPEA